MAVLLVTYDLNSPGQNHSNLLKTIKEYPWAKLSESSYAIKTLETPSTIFNLLKQYIDKNDNLYVVTMKKPYSGYGPQEVNDWLESNLPI
ncbi:hypothetical protein EM77_001990 [Vibrio parahaemolyticus]|nr:hypothetical protein [Vibrio parahaemolyticus]EGR1384306.1 hypothetical protein [Vibrio parahaemolyticus]EGR2232629.1 hypothetical protein [Vibrio parahaemolyticus]EGR3289573.1 hypothetical protein [Vibrio parahaemolyticus]ODW85442.1 hypothetical protein BBM89_05385 [Vibrio parahaemolyticus]